jgi:hypothetical protein
MTKEAVTEKEQKLMADLRKHAALCKRATTIMNSTRYMSQQYRVAQSEFSASRIKMNEIQRQLDKMEVDS